MHEELWHQLLKMDLDEVAKRARCNFDPDSQKLIITVLREEYEVDCAGKSVTVSSDSSPAQAGFMEQLCVLAYLINAKDTPASGKLVTGDRLDAGEFFFRGPHELPTGKLETNFGDATSLLIDAAEKLGGKICSFGDASAEILLLPRVPLTFVIWARDEEFDARASILFDSTAANQLPLDALGAGVGIAVKKLCGAVD